MNASSNFLILIKDLFQFPSYADINWRPVINFWCEFSHCKLISSFVRPRLIRQWYYSV